MNTKCTKFSYTKKRETLTISDVISDLRSKILYGCMIHNRRQLFSRVQMTQKLPIIGHCRPSKITQIHKAKSELKGAK